VRHDRGGLLLYPGVAVSSRPTGHNQPAPAAFQRPTLHPRRNIPPQREAVTRHQRRFTLLTRPIFPRPVTPGWSGNPSAFPSGFTPRRYRRRMPRRELVSRTLTRDYTFDINRSSIGKSTHILRPRVALPSVPRGGGVHTTGVLPGRRLPLLNGQPCRPGLQPAPGRIVDEASARVHCHSPHTSLPLACDPVRNGVPWAFP
jgi:hypothetical protein